MVEIKAELSQRFRDSPFYLEKEQKKDVRRYTDKYCMAKKEDFEPFWDRLPTELNWKQGKAAKLSAKKRRLEEKELTEERLKALEKAEQTIVIDEKKVVEEKDEDLEDEQEEQGIVEDDEEPVSDEDYLEGENDYVQNYFDAGDAYDEDDNNLDDEAY